MTQVELNGVTNPREKSYDIMSTEKGISTL